MKDKNDPCRGPIHPKAMQGILYFNKGMYYESHEALEDAWKVEGGPIRDLYKGILQTAVVYFHITRLNYEGAVKMYARSQKWLRDWPEVCRGIHIGQLRRDLESTIAQVQRLGQEPISSIDADNFKPITWNKMEKHEHE
ncbi:MAG: DUF309 domain-containing protein [Anaerolineales bacterium]|nr:DUF309 domain-containing protein [Anaerolineales bacterium]